MTRETYGRAGDARRIRKQIAYRLTACAQPAVHRYRYGVAAVRGHPRRGIVEQSVSIPHSSLAVEGQIRKSAVDRGPLHDPLGLVPGYVGCQIGAPIWGVVGPRLADDRIHAPSDIVNFEPGSWAPQVRREVS